MPRKLELTFQKGTAGRLGRWRKKYRGRVHYLGSGPSKSDVASYKLALVAWKSLKLELDKDATPAAKPFDPEYEEVIQEWERVLAWAVQYNDDSEAVVARQKLQELRERREAKSQLPVGHQDSLWSRFRVEPSVLNDIADVALASSKSTTAEEWDRISDDMRAVGFRARSTTTPIRDPTVPIRSDVPSSVEEEIRWRDRIESQQRLHTESAEDTVKSWAETYLTKQRERVAADELSAGRYKSLHSCVSFFRDWLGAETPVTSINGRVLTRFHSLLLEQVTSGQCAAGYARDRLTVAKSFIKWLWGQDAFENLPKNIDSRELRITRRSTTPSIFSIAEVGQLLRKASARTRLYVLLALNTGMTQKDMADLRDSEVDWEKGKLTRKRSKTQKHEGVPTVTYKLWPETFDLLKKYRSGEERVLLNSHGQPLYREWIDDQGKYSKLDNIRSAYDRVMRELPFNKSLKLLRKTSPSLMEGEARFRGLGKLFLGQAPNSVADKHYIQQSETALDEAIDFLHVAYKIESAVSQMATELVEELPCVLPGHIE